MEDLTPSILPEKLKTFEPSDSNVNYPISLPRKALTDGQGVGAKAREDVRGYKEKLPEDSGRFLRGGQGSRRIPPVLEAQPNKNNPSGGVARLH